MKPEIKAKVDEVLKSLEHRELNMDELELVSGGAEPTITVNGGTMTKAEFNNSVLVVYDQVGHDVAYNLFIACTGWQPSGKFYGSREEMENLLIDYWASVK